jgi:hypothetical protein
MRRKITVQPIEKIENLNSKTKKFIPIIDDLNPFLQYLNATELHLIIYFSAKFHIKIDGVKWKKDNAVFSVSQIQSETGRNRRDIKQALITLLEIGFIKYFSLENHQLFIALNTPENENIKDKISGNMIQVVTRKTNTSCDKLLHGDDTSCYNPRYKLLQPMIQVVTSQTKSNLIITRVSELPKNIKELYKNLYYKKENPKSEKQTFPKSENNNNKINNKNEIKISELDLSFLSNFSFTENLEKENQEPEIKLPDSKNILPGKINEIETVNNSRTQVLNNPVLLTQKESSAPAAPSRLSTSGKIITTLLEWGFWKMPEDTREEHETRLIKKVRYFASQYSEDMLYQMIECVKNKGFDGNKEKNSYLGSLIKNPDNFNYSPEFVSNETIDKIQKEKDFLNPLKTILNLRTGTMPSDILTESLEKLISFTKGFRKGYIKAAEELAKEFFKSKESINKPMNKTEKQTFLNKQYDLFENDRKEFKEISGKILKAYSVNDLKTVLNKAFEENRQRTIVKDFVKTSGQENAVIRILSSLSEASEIPVNISFMQEKKQENKIIEFPEKKNNQPEISEKEKPDNGFRSLAGALGFQHLENKNPEFYEYIRNDSKRHV